MPLCNEKGCDAEVAYFANGKAAKKCPFHLKEQRERKAASLVEQEKRRTMAYVHDVCGRTFTLPVAFTSRMMQLQCALRERLLAKNVVGLWRAFVARQKARREAEQEIRQLKQAVLDDMKAYAVRLLFATRRAKDAAAPRKLTKAPPAPAVDWTPGPALGFQQWRDIKKMRERRAFNMRARQNLC